MKFTLFSRENGDTMLHMTPEEFEQAILDAQQKVFAARRAFTTANAAAAAAEDKRYKSWLYSMIGIYKDLDALKAKAQSQLDADTRARDQAVVNAQGKKMEQYAAEKALADINAASLQTGATERIG